MGTGYFRHTFEVILNSEIMSKDKNTKGKGDKTPPTMNLKEKRAAKAAKKGKKSQSGMDL